MFSGPWVITNGSKDCAVNEYDFCAFGAESESFSTFLGG